jgi:hypothetical protein
MLFEDIVELQLQKTKKVAIILIRTSGNVCRHKATDAATSRNRNKNSN